MKIKVREMSYDQVMALPRPARKKPKRPNALFRAIVRLSSSLTPSDRQLIDLNSRPAIYVPILS